MRPAQFEYHRPGNVDEAVRMLDEHAGSEILAGGQSLVPAMNRRQARPDGLVDISGLESLAYVEETGGGGLMVGALTTHDQLLESELVETHASLLTDAASELGDPIVRNDGTVGGNLAQAAPNADYPAPVVALDTTLHVRGQDEERTIEAAEFFTGAFETALDSGELLTEIEIPPSKGTTAQSYRKVTRRKNDPPLAAAAACLDFDGSGNVSDARIVLGAVEDTPTQVPDAESRLEDSPLDDTAIEEAAAATRSAADAPRSDAHASADYRREIAETLTRKALTDIRNREAR